MKWKMAENSMFAVLLRSPWWVSIAVVAAFALVSRALLPQQYVVFGMMGGFPFLVIGIITAIKQFRAPRPERVARTLQLIADMPWRDFASLLEKAYANQGFTVIRQSAGAADLQLSKDGRTTLVTGKRWKAANHGNDPLRALRQARQDQAASHCVYVTLVQVSENTRRFAVENKIELVHGAALAELLHDVAPP